MKKLTLLLVALAFSVRLHADDVLQNSDFTDGINHWYGDGRAPAEFAPASPLDPPSPYGTVGLIVPLKPHDWTKVTQDFRTKSSTLVMNITFKLTSDATFSTTADDYVNVPHRIGFDHWLPFNGKPGGWMAMISDFTKERITYYDILAKPGVSDEQTYSGTIETLAPEDQKTITLAFPPGTGAVILLHVSLTGAQ